jgi:hypothetical protein
MSYSNNTNNNNHDGIARVKVSWCWWGDLFVCDLVMVACGAGSDDEEEDDEEGEGFPRNTTIIQLTEEESAAVERLVTLGCDRQQVIEAYYLWDRTSLG